MQMSTWAATDQGRVRKQNEDHYRIAPDLGLIAVADGMGGFERGEVASELACSVLRETLMEFRTTLSNYAQDSSVENRVAVLDLLEFAFQKACAEVHAAADAFAAGGRMGTTLDALIVINKTAFLAHVGDGRIYLLRNEEIHQLTDDHSLVAEQVRAGTLTPEQAKTSKNRSVITRALGPFPSVKVDTLDFQLDSGDRFVLCTDGLYRYIDVEGLANLLRSHRGQDATSMLIDTANRGGGKDNITVVLSEIDPKPSEEDTLPQSSRMDALRKVELFATCTYRELMAIRRRASTRSFGAGQLIFHEGELGRECYFIESGHVKIEKDGMHLTTLGPGSSFGEMSFLDIPRRSATAITATPVSLLILHRDSFIQLMKQDAELGAKISWQLLKKMSRIIRLSNEHLADEFSTFNDDTLEIPT